jgi:2-polyprenyl-3-methyl-5-hydroxy-6-metoxy-1,4-benzoquinol methylase
MDDQAKIYAGEMVNSLSESWKCALITAGLNAGIFSAMDAKKPISVKDLASSLDYDEDKLEKWFYYCESMGLVQKSNGGYLIGLKSGVFMPGSPYKDLVGFMKLNDFFMRAAIESPESFRKDKSLDKLSEGKITREYQPKVSDNLSAEIINIFKLYKVADGDTMLDIGCGAGAFDRTVLRSIPGINITGFDSNLFAVETAKKENKQEGMSGRIKMIVGDAREDLIEYKNGSFDWVIAINVFHFYPMHSRLPLMEDMIRLAKKGVFFTEIIAERTKLSFAADPLMALLWSDFTGFFREDDAEKINSEIMHKCRGCKVEKHPILQNSSWLVAILKKQ